VGDKNPTGKNMIADWLKGSKGHFFLNSVILSSALMLSHTVMSGMLDEVPSAASRAPSSIESSTIPLMSSSSHDVLIKVDEAFRVKWSYDGTSVRGEFSIAPGCYLYQDRFKLMLKGFDQSTSGVTQSDTTTFKLGEIEMPTGELLEDAILGGTHRIFRNGITLTAPVIAIGRTQSPTPQSIEVEAVWQGCLESKLCYPAVRKTIQLKAP
jgi:thiol:disulfide interchange protein